MKLIDLTLRDFMKEVDSPSPAPGGGSVCAYAVAQGIGLLRMVAHLTISKKKFMALDEEIKIDYLNRMATLDDLKIRVIELVDKDTEAFNEIMKAFKLPKETEEEINLRNKAIEEATIIATKVPYETTTIAHKAIEVSYPMFKNANKNAISDLGVGIMMINAGLVGAILNVKINMNSFTDKNISSKYLDSVKHIEEEVKVNVEKALDYVNRKLS